LGKTLKENTMKKIRIAQIGVLHDHAPVIFDSLMKLEDFEVVGFAREEAGAPLTGAFVGASAGGLIHD
jgi:hypothetical protein